MIPTPRTMVRTVLDAAKPNIDPVLYRLYAEKYLSLPPSNVEMACRLQAEIVLAWAKAKTVPRRA